jgi:DNA-binding PadR family transcriptional regulator
LPRPALETQNLTKGCNEALILATLRDGPKHGYQLAVDIETASDGYFRFNHGTLYPILHKLEKDGLIKGDWSDEGPRGRRKVYGLTRAGRGLADRQRTAWREFTGRLQSVIDGGGA